TTKGKVTKISQSSRPTNLVADETVHKEKGDRMERTAITASSLEAKQDSEAQTRFEDASKLSYEPPLSRVNTLGSEEDSMKLNELMELCTKLSKKYCQLQVNAAKHKLTTVVYGEACEESMSSSINPTPSQCQTPTFAETHNLVAFLENLLEKEGFEQIVDFLNANLISMHNDDHTLYAFIYCTVLDFCLGDLRLDDAGRYCMSTYDTILKNWRGDKKEVLDLEEAKTAQAKEIASLKKRVKKLEKSRKSRFTTLKRLKKVALVQKLDFVTHALF
ncbi:hypothetical protein Tco_0946502, partial [Tanacetum coccineum]